jgi:hypothetical protein
MPRFKDAADNRYYTALRDQFRAAGLSRQALEAGVSWYESLGNRSMTQEERAASFQDFMAQRGFGDAVPQIMGAYDAVLTHGPEASMARRSAADDVRVIELAQQKLKSDPDGYWRDFDLLEDYSEALDRQSQAPSAAPNGTPAVEQPSPSVSRRAEIERAMRENGGREYWSNSAMQLEYGAILSSQVSDGATTMDPGAPPTDTGAAPRPADGSTVGGF